MTAHCAMLATRLDIRTFRCPTDMHRFHYHGIDARQPYRPLVGGHICKHRHQTVNAADACTERNIPRG